ncbi:MAG: LytTR family DNA-binding domain-containing protein [Pseudomonadota bacterium]
MAFVLGIGGALTGPYGSFFTLELWPRVLYWQAVILGSFANWRMIESVVERIVGDQSYIAKRIVVTAPFAIVNSTYVLILLAVIAWLQNDQLRVGWRSLVISHLTLSTMVVLPAIVIVRRMRGDLESKAGGEAIAFLTEKLPGPLRGQKPYALAAEGHYVRVHTPIGDELITMRFEDALAAVVGIEGVQTHRSWWVATDAVDEVRRTGSAYEAVLDSGLTVPVGRRRKADVTKALRERAPNDER